MRRMITLVCCFAVCFFLMAGCNTICGSPTQSNKQSQADNINLLVKIDIEKNGAPLDSLSSIVSKDRISISHACQEKQESDDCRIMLSFVGSNIKKSSEDSCSMDYSISMQLPLVVSRGKDMKSVQHTAVGSNSSINIKLGQPAYIYESSAYKVKLTITQK
jgi:hypothetical protein